ncbi:MAG TPA: glycosyltransferase [Saprospiraceae bacterium]|nr:glycosyltransferase [Saprospiraceae bacterium]
MSSPRLSIFIPTRNEAKYIGTTLAQFEPFWDKYDLEIIVSDANSTDGTIDIVRHFATLSNQRVKLVEGGPGKQNIAIGCNLGAAQAKAPLLFRIDADVRIPDKEYFLEKVFKAFDKDPKLVGATVPIWVYPEEARLSDKLYHIMMNAIIRGSFWVKAPLAKGECQLVRREAFQKVGGYAEHLTAGEDCNLFYRLQDLGKIRYLRRLRIHHSPRRFRQYGYIPLTMIYLREGLWMLLGKKSYLDEWKPVR